MDLQMFFTVVGVLSFVRGCFKVEDWLENSADQWFANARIWLKKLVVEHGW